MGVYNYLSVLYTEKKSIIIKYDVKKIDWRSEVGGVARTGGNWEGAIRSREGETDDREETTGIRGRKRLNKIF